MPRSFVGTAFERVFHLTSSINYILGVGKVLDPCIDRVLILGGASNEFGLAVCRNLIHNQGVKIVVVDKIDRADSIFENRSQDHSTSDIQNRSECNNDSQEYGIGQLNVTVTKKIVGLEECQRNHYYKFIRCEDFSNKEYVLKAMEEVFKAETGITIFINNIHEGLEDYTDMSGNFDSKTISMNLMNHSISRGSAEKFEACVKSNLTNVMLATKYFLNRLVPQTKRLVKPRIPLESTPGFYIINISSVLTFYAPAFTGFYVSSKTAMNQFHESLTSELGLYNGNRIKTLLVYLPYVKGETNTGRTWYCLGEDLVAAIKYGRRGEISLSADNRLIPAQLDGFKEFYHGKFWKFSAPSPIEYHMSLKYYGWPHVSDEGNPIN